ncbi:MAG: dihydroorotase [Firmicutes bacterium]|nr:dihydroorotase [Bacillota bacterium]
MALIDVISCTDSGRQDRAVLMEDGRALTTQPSCGHPVPRRGELYLFPGFADVHVHLREPGFSYKETIASGTRAAAHGGYTAVCPMPNLRPVPDSAEHLRAQTEIIRRDAAVDVYPYGAITRDEQGQELADLPELAPLVVAFSDDGRGVQSREQMRRAMEQARELHKLIVAHCEDESLLHGGCIHDGEYARRHGYPGICSASEWKQIERDLELAADTGCGYHVCHVSCRESVSLLRQAKADGVDVTWETAPHYLLLDDSMLEDDGRFRMNPPIRGRADREALLEAAADGTLDMIATDHAPHSAAEKAGGLRRSLNGIVGLEAAFSVLYTGLVKTGVITLERLLELMAYNPRRRFGLPLREGDFTVFDLDTSFTVDSASFLSQGRSTPFAGWPVQGRCLLTAVDGRIAWQDPSLNRYVND